MSLPASGLRRLALETGLIHADRGVDPGARAISPAISPSSSYRARDEEEFTSSATAVNPREFYARYGSPTHRHAEELIAAAEGAESALLFGSGMAALSSTLLALLDAGAHVVLQRSHYPGTTHLVAGVLSRFGIESTPVDQTDSGAFERAMRANTRVVIAETPSNPILALTDLRAVAEIAHAGGGVLLVDNTLATPVNQRPIEHGADLVMHSATKFLGGHSDLLAGAIAGRRDLVETVWHITRSLGATLGAFDAWLLARGMRTLALRVGRQNESALTIATFLSQHPSVVEVNYPGLARHPQHALAAHQMKGFGGVMSIRLRGGMAAAERMLAKVRLFSRAPSLGGVESLAVRPAAMLATILTPDRKADGGMADDLVRLSIGIESPDDLRDDLVQALARE